MSNRVIGAGLFDWAGPVPAPVKEGQAPLGAVWPDLKSRRWNVTFNVPIDHGAPWIESTMARLEADVTAGREMNLRVALGGNNQPDASGQYPRHGVEAEILAGKWDDALEELADRTKPHADKLVISWGNECTSPHMGNTPGLFPKSFRYAVDLFRKRGNKARWGFCIYPNVQHSVIVATNLVEPGSGMTNWLPGAKYLDRLEVDIYKLADCSGPLKKAGGQNTTHGNLVEFLAMGKGENATGHWTRAITENGCAHEDLTVARVDATFDFAEKNGIGLMVWNNINYDTPQFLSWGWYGDGCLQHFPTCRARFLERATKFTAVAVPKT